HLVPDDAAQLRAELLRDALGDRARGDPAGLRVPDLSLAATAELERDLGELRRLPGARLARHDDDLVVADRGGDVRASGADRELLGVRDGRDRHGLARLRGPLELRAAHLSRARRRPVAPAAPRRRAGRRGARRRAVAPPAAAAVPAATTTLARGALGGAALLGRARVRLVRCGLGTHDGPFSQPAATSLLPRAGRP